VNLETEEDDKRVPFVLNDVSNAVYNKVFVKKARKYRNGNDKFHGGSMEKHGMFYGIGFGSAMAMIISYAHLHSIIWMAIHGLFSWFYVAYFIILKPY